jgi:hypothetical protein
MDTESVWICAVRMSTFFLQIWINNHSSVLWSYSLWWIWVILWSEWLKQGYQHSIYWSICDTLLWSEPWLQNILHWWRPQVNNKGEFYQKAKVHLAKPVDVLFFVNYTSVLCFVLSDLQCQDWISISSTVKRFAIITKHALVPTFWGAAEVSSSCI